MVLRFRQQQEASGLDGRSSEDDHFCFDVVVLHRFVVDEMGAGGFAGVGIGRDFADDGVGADGEVAGVGGGIDEAGGRIECGVNVATAFAFASAAAETAAAIFIVLEAVGGDTGAILRQRAVQFRFESFLQRDFGAVQLGRALKDAVGEPLEAFFDAGDAEVEVDLVVVGREVAVADRPIFAEAVAVVGFEIVVGEAQREAAPDVGLAAKAAGADPGVVCAGVGIFAFVDGDVFYIVAVADVALEVFGAFETGSVGRATNGVLVVVERMLVGGKGATVLVVVRPLHRAEFLFDRELFSGFEEQNLGAVRCQDMAGHAARGT